MQRLLWQMSLILLQPVVIRATVALAALWAAARVGTLRTGILVPHSFATVQGWLCGREVCPNEPAALESYVGVQLLFLDLCWAFASLCRSIYVCICIYI